MVIALDIGTSSARATLCDPAGAPVPGAEHRVEYDAHTTVGGGVEHDPRHLADAAAACIDGVLPRGEDVSGIGISTFWHGLLGFDAQSRPVTPVYTWADTRSSSAADDLRRRLDARAVHDRTGCHLHSSYWPAKLRWLRSSGLASGVRWWGSAGELLAVEWFGEGATSVSMASGTGLFDQRAGRWDPEMLEAAGIDERQLFPLRDRDAPWRDLREPWASRWPALRRAAWFPAIGDGAASNVGSGCTRPDRVAISVGTSSAMRLITGLAPPATPPGLWRYRVDRKLAVTGGALSEGGNVRAWCANALRLPDDDAIEWALLRDADRDAGLTALPFLAGERSPGWNDHARAAIAGLSLATAPIDMLRAALESVALRLALVYEQLAPLAASPHDIVASGGALTRSRAWTQMIADALGRPLVRSTESEATSHGIALLVLESLGRLSDLAAVPLPAGERVEPDPGRHQRYRDLAARQGRLYTALFGPTDAATHRE
jgi:gluconokinase